MKRSASVVALMALVAAFTLSPAVEAQQAGTIEMGLFGQRTAFDQSTTLAFGTAPGFGGLVGMYVLENVALEAATSFTWTHPAAPPRVRATWAPLRLRATWHIPASETFYPIVGLGIVRNGYGDAVTGSDVGMGAIVGFKTYVEERVAFRAAGHLDRISSPFNEGDAVGGSTVSAHTNWNLTAGVSIDLGKGRFRDSDLDGVRDRADMCPATPAGVSVDAVGCRVDSDGDLVWDEDDDCPLTPRGVAVDRRGCRLDGDMDRVFDEDDVCPMTPAGVAVDGVGCALDTDSDRVPDYLDECAATPAGVGVDAVGCRLDSDADGVWDEDDRCPGTAPGIEVDPEGCQILFEEEAVVLVLEGVTFETASADLTPEALSVLQGIAAALVANPEIRVRVNGHTDSTGSRPYNITLSQNRAESVVAYLTAQGVDATRLVAQGFGPDQPVATNETPEGRQENRRVELERIN